MQMNICLRDLPTRKKSRLPSRVPTHAYARLRDCEISGQQPTQLHKEFPRVHEVGHSKKNAAHLWKRCCILGKHTIPASWPGVHCTRKIRCSTKWRHKLWCSLPNQTIRWNYTCQCCARQRGRWRVFSFRPFSTLSKLQNSKKKGSEQMILSFHHLSSTGVLSSEMEKKTCHQQFRQMHGGVH